jgi:hypothetical protein
VEVVDVNEVFLKGDIEDGKEIHITNIKDGSTTRMVMRYSS